MYQVTCDDFPLLDVRTDEYILVSPKIKVEVNKVGGGSFTIHKNHPNYNTIQLMKSVIEVKDEIGVIFRGRATENTRDFNNGKAIDLEGVMGYFNDSIVRPFNFPQDFISDAGYISESESGNVVEFFLKWLIDNHNSQVQEFQKLKLGVVTVSDPNNYITRSDSNYKKTWEIIKSKLFESSLGGFLCIRYEDDGNYIDYLSTFEQANAQPIEFSKNLLDIKSKTSASATYTAIIPIGAEIEEEVDGEIVNKKLDITTKADGVVSPGIIKKGDMLYSEEAVNRFGWIVAPVSDTTWDDVTTVDNLVKNGVTWLATQGAATATSIDIKAVDLHFSDAEIQSFRIYRNVFVSSVQHNHNTVYRLTKLDIDLLNPQNTKITVGASRLSLVNASNKALEDATNNIAATQKEVNENKAEISYLRTQMTEETAKIIKTCDEMISSALEDYVETSDYSEFKKTVETELKALEEIFHGQKLIWGADMAEGMYMTEEHTATLAEKVSEQPNGIVLVFCYYNDASDTNWGFQSFFVPKQLVSLEPGDGHTFQLTNGKYGTVGTKYLYINDDKIVGHADNNASGTAGTGITFNSAKFVMRYVIGV